MIRWLICFFCFSTLASAGVGQITKVVGENNAYLMRDGTKIPITLNQTLEKNDDIYSENTYLVIYLFPSTQMSLSKNSQVKINENLIEEGKELERVTSIIDFIKGIIRVQVTKDSNQQIEQKVATPSAVFAVRGTEFEVSFENDQDVDLDVFEGVVEASSPLVQSFVPEYVKANEGLRLSRKEKKFSKRRFSPKFRNHPGFMKKEAMRERWKKIRGKKKKNKNKVKQKKKTTKAHPNKRRH